MSVPANITLPSDEARITIDKTVGYILKNGTGFEQRLKDNNKDHKFDFLEEGNQFNEYFKWKIGRHEQSQQKAPTASSSEDTPIIAAAPLQFKTKFPRAVSNLDCDIIKLTAMFVARNGEGYLTKLIHHQHKLGNKAQFEFTKSSHSLYQLFRQYVTQYRAILRYLSEEEALSIDEDVILNAYKRAQYIGLHTEKKKKERKNKEDIQKHYASIDWQDFALVAKVEFDAIDEVQELAVPLSRQDLVNRSLEAKRKEVEMFMAAPIKEQEPPIEPETELQDQPSIPKAETTQHMPVIKGMKIRAAGESRLRKAVPGTSENTIKCPITGNDIPELQFDTHLKVLLRNPRYKEEQDNFMRKNFKYESNLTTDQVYENIKRFVRKRQVPEDADEKIEKRLKIGPNLD
ncbi:uncharacterized protein CANTADRAFT_45761 [Suhomyces tanzawaensis NRRL Y-17324]|uniref:SURP motif domain-containing protein n=1 Tax=Suhomyces tanzawaensis NRRL Y-17324 TaxID=984487 RepID=A0A1E4SQG0_9ASCO|nr:uncharacterized protein CANTADRAFT_45761 [Suhomyces tanzawaensis NRRL Y-17324]ODV81739.1 hypothetical protein CANTADRAFT_45761 [Suhomyces tanzawaensis NRRL Y-17324]